MGLKQGGYGTKAGGYGTKAGGYGTKAGGYWQGASPAMTPQLELRNIGRRFWLIVDLWEVSKLIYGDALILT